MEDLNTGARLHKISMTNRKNCTVSGVKDVISFDINEVNLLTDQGILNFKGQDLHVNRLTLDKGEVDISGKINGLAYTEDFGENSKETSIISRLFR